MPRSSIARLMAMVAVVAANAAAARILFALNVEILIGVALPAVAMEFAVYCLVSRRRPGRGFWLGFILLGALTMATFVWNQLDPEVLALTRSGQLIRQEGSLFYHVWSGYAGILGDFLVPPLEELGIFGNGWNPYGVSAVGIRAIVWSLPQLVIALAGGVFIWAMARRGKVAPRRIRRFRCQVTLPIESGSWWATSRRSMST